jgi:hypothetical protein
MELERTKRKSEFVALKVSSPAVVPICTVTVTHRGVDIMPSAHIHITVPYELQFKCKNCNFLHLNKNMLLQAVA